MQYDLSVFWLWLVVALLLGAFVGWYTRENQNGSWLDGWFGWGLVVFIGGALLAFFAILPGRWGWLLELMLISFLAYIIGGHIGTILGIFKPKAAEPKPSQLLEATRPSTVVESVKPAVVSAPPVAEKPVVAPQIAATPAAVAALASPITAAASSTMPASSGPAVTELSADTGSGEKGADSALSPGDAGRPKSIARPDDNGDNLKLIKGVGPKNEAVLNALGVYRFGQIADWGTEEEHWVGHHIAFPGRVAREHWVAQAKLLAKGVDTEHSAGVKSGAIKLDAAADAPLSDSEINALQSKLPTLTSQAATSSVIGDAGRPKSIAKPDDNGDNLKLIKGIGPKNEAVLNALGVYRFGQIADWGTEEEHWVGHHIAFPGRVAREHWVAQAKLLAKGVDTEHSAGVKSGAIKLDAAADAPMSDSEINSLKSKLLTQSSQAATSSVIGDAGRPKSIARPADNGDDLKLIKGIGPKNEAVLNALGVYRFGQIADWGTEEEHWVGHHIAFPGRVAREHWVAQAKLLNMGVDTEHSAGVKSGAIKLDAAADAPLSDSEAKAFIVNLPALAPKVDGEDKFVGNRPAGLSTPQGKADDLKRISGIGKQNESRLNALGIYYFRQIAAWTPENVKWVGGYLAFPGRIDREQWIDQAKTLASGAETDFSLRVEAGKVPSSKN